MSEAEPTSPASSVTTLLDDWSIEIDADHFALALMDTKLTVSSKLKGMIKRRNGEKRMKMRTKTELTLEQTQQGVIDEVLVLRRLESIFTSMYVAVQKLKKDSNTNNVKDSELASLFGKLKYEENLIDNIYETEKNKSLVSATPLSTAFFSSSIFQDFQDSPDDEEDTRSIHEYLNDLEEEYQARALLAKSKRFFKKGTQSWSKTSVSAYQSPFKPKPLSSPQHKPELRPIKDFEAKYNKVKAKLALLSSSASASKASMVKNKGLIAEAYEWDEEEVSSDDNEMVEVKVLMALAEENDVVSKEGARNGEWVKISMRKVHTLLEIEDNDDRKVYLNYLCIDLNYVEEQRSNLLSKHRNLVHELNTCKEQLLVLKQAKLDFLTMQHVNTEILKENKNLRTELKELKAITETWLNSSNKKLEGAEPISGPKTIKSILRSNSTFKVEALKGVIINEPSSAPAKGNKSSSASKVHSAPAGKLKSVKIKDDPPLAIVMKELNNLRLQVSKNQSCYSRSNQSQQYISTMNMSQHLKSLGRASSRSKIARPSKCFFLPCTYYGCIDHLSNECLCYPICGLCGNPRNPQHTLKRCEVCGSSTHTTTNHYDIEWFKRGETLQAKKAEALKSTRAESSNANRSKTPTKSGCSRHMTGVKSYLYKYVEHSGPKVVSGDDFTCTIEGYGSITCNDIVFTKVAFLNGLKYNLISISQLYDAKYIVQFDEKRGTIFKSNKEVVMIAPTSAAILSKWGYYIYVLDMTSSAQESCFFAKASKDLNWLWHKRLAHLNFKTINKLAKQILVIGLPTLVYSKDKSCSSREKESIIEPFTSTIIKITWENLMKKLMMVIFLDTHLFPRPSEPSTLEDNKLKKPNITFEESLDAIKFSKPSVNDINIAKTERYPPDEYLHPYEPSQRYQTNNNDVSFIEPYEYPKPIVLETEVSSDQNG
ncbi:retrovirus-related pol polyprotein from transposon TNT 1-94 [Tanacetum coccineum]|uniref:Retrovirus-related pol polyprotein from transposon TNT 1-94 n=1 Tax=Tanacetum coccineum TaxID=301880 RepID=A0ABQ5G0T9_9ASTR